MVVEHVVMMPFMAQGHLIPFAALAELLSELHSLKITLVNTPHNASKLRSMMNPKAAGAIDVAELPFSSADHGLPPDAENTDALPYPLILRLFEASETLEPAFESLISDVARKDGRLPLCIVADVFCGWTVLVAERLGIHHVVFTTCGAFGTLGYASTWLHLPHVGTDADEFPVPGMPGVRLHRTQLASHLRVADGKDGWSIFLQKHISLSMHRSRGDMLCNTVAELEPDGIRLLQTMTGSRVLPIGPLLPLSLFSENWARERGGKPLGISAESCIAWLDTQPLRSVLYVSFGSQNTVSRWQLKELALGLEASGAGFIWVVRPPLEFPMTAEFRSEWLPEGFEERVKDRGLIVKGWAPQLAILSHKGTGAFLSHCGWNSVLESLSQGVPLIGWPMAGEQFYNTIMLGDEKVGVCVEVGRGKEVGVDREKVARVVAEVVKGEKGAEMRRKAGEMREDLRKGMAEEESGGGSSLRALDEFVASIVSPHVHFVA
ncbi:hypothetical protein AMTRI_Chr11g99750 [Amborella trichopoda]